MRPAKGSSIRWRPFRFARIHSLLAMTHARDRNPLGSSEVNSVIRCSANGVSSAKSSRMRARSDAGTETPGPATRRPIASAASQSASRAACDPMDQSTWVASIPTGYALGEARPRRPPSCERRSSPRAAPVPPRPACRSPCRGAPSTFGRRPPDRGRPRHALQARGPERRLRRRASPSSRSRRPPRPERPRSRVGLWRLGGRGLGPGACLSGSRGCGCCGGGGGWCRSRGGGGCSCRRRGGDAGRLRQRRRRDDDGHGGLDVHGPARELLARSDAVGAHHLQGRFVGGEPGREADVAGHQQEDHDQSDDAEQDRHPVDPAARVELGGDGGVDRRLGERDPCRKDDEDGSKHDRSEGSHPPRFSQPARSFRNSSVGTPWMSGSRRWDSNP